MSVCVPVRASVCTSQTLLTQYLENVGLNFTKPSALIQFFTYLLTYLHRTKTSTKCAHTKRRRIVYFMKLLKANARSVNITKYCQREFDFELPGAVPAQSSREFLVDIDCAAVSFVGVASYGALVSFTSLCDSIMFFLLNI